MRVLLSLVFAFALSCGQLMAGMYGDFFIPEAFKPQIHSEDPYGGRITVVLPMQNDESLVLYLSTRGEAVAAGTAVEAVAGRVEAGQEPVVFDVGGRAWVGYGKMAPEGVLLYDGYIYENDVLYEVSFSTDSRAEYNPEIRFILSRLKLYAGQGGSPATPLVGEATELVAQGQMDQAESLLSRARSADANNPYVYAMSALVNEYRQNYEAALASYRQAVSRKPDDAFMNARVLGLEYMLNQSQEAADKMVDLADRFPNEPSVWEELAMVYMTAGDAETATEYFEDALWLNPTSESALFNLAFIYKDAGNNEEAYRKVRELRFYRPWIPEDAVPDVKSALASTSSIDQEPISTGFVREYAATPAPEVLTQQQVLVTNNIIWEPQPIYIYETPAPVYNYYPTFSFFWYNDRDYWYHDRPWYRPSWWDDHRRPPRPPHKPPRPPRPPDRPTPRPPDRPTPDRPRPDRPDRPTPDRPRPDRPDRPTPDRPRPDRPDRPTPDRPTPTPRPDRPTPTPRPDRPTPTPRPDRPTPDRPTPTPRPDRPTPTPRPTPSERPTPAPRPTPTERPTPQVRPQPVERPQPQTRPQPVERPQPQARPQPAERPQPQARPQQQSRPQPQARPAPQRESRPAPSRPAPSHSSGAEEVQRRRR